MLDNLMDKLPDVYNKSEQSGIYKIIKLAADQIAQGEDTLRLIQEWRDIDKAEGRTLDKLGKDVGQVREGLDDEQYRQVIKIKIRSNLSGGEIETLNSIAVVLAGDRFDGIREGWTLPTDHPMGQRPAMMLFTIVADGVNFGIPMAAIDSISAGGVASNWELLIKSNVQMRTQYTKSEEQDQTYHSQVSVGSVFSMYQQTYFRAGEAIAGGNQRNMRGAL